jgi:carboxyl-terminal processing protease
VPRPSRIALVVTAVAALSACTPARMPRLAQVLAARGGPAQARIEQAFAVIRDEYVTEPDLATLEEAARAADEHVLASEPVASADRLVEAAVTAMLERLDPYSSYLSRDLYTELRRDTGDAGGIGLEVTIRDGVLTVVEPIDGAPAERAGIAGGDAIVAIDGEPTASLTLVDVVHRLRGPLGTRVTLAVERKGVPRFDVAVTRETVRLVAVKSRLLDGGYGYLKVKSIPARAADDAERALRGVEPADGFRGVILDLRGNPGGLLTESARLADVFVDEGLIAWTEGRDERQQKRFVATRRARRNVPMVVLVDHGTAAGSEVVAAALQDHRRALVVGFPTFGRGTVQTIFALEAGTALKLTTGRLRTPNGASIEGVGVKPDVLVGDGEPLARGEEDLVLREAVERLGGAPAAK